MPRVLLVVFLLAFSVAEAATCTVVRDARGNIARSTTVLNHFKKLHPKPAGEYIIDHAQSLELCGADHVSNLVWMTKTQARAKDRWEGTPQWRARLAKCTIDLRRVMTCPHG